MSASFPVYQFCLAWISTFPLWAKACNCDENVKLIGWLKTTHTAIAMISAGVKVAFCYAAMRLSVKDHVGIECVAPLLMVWRKRRWRMWYKYRTVLWSPSGIIELSLHQFNLLIADSILLHLVQNIGSYPIHQVIETSVNGMPRLPGSQYGTRVYKNRRFMERAR